MASLFFLPTSLFLSNTPVRKKSKKFIVTTIVIAALLTFNVRNLKRINYELSSYNGESFPFFYVPKGETELINLDQNINLYLPTNIDACWATKTPCVGGVNDKITVSKILGFNVFKMKYITFLRAKIFSARG